MQLPQFDHPTKYQIQVEGVLDEDWRDWFEAVELSVEGNITTLTGEIPDQPALYGLILKLRNLGLKLLSVQQIDVD